MRLNINDREIVQFTNKLEKMHRKHLPTSIRNTLNEVALKEVKQKSLISTTDSVFEKRRKNFFKANSRVSFATGWDIRSMKSEVGMSSNKLSSNNYAVKDLQKQEVGGSIGGRSFIPLNKARVSSSWNRMVKKKYRINSIKKIVDSKENKKGRNKKERFILSALYAGKGGFVIGTNKTSSGARVLFEIKGIDKKRSGIKVNLNPIYSVKSSRSVNVKKTGFMAKSANKGASKLNLIFVKNAKNELAR